MMTSSGFLLALLCIVSLRLSQAQLDDVGLHPKPGEASSASSAAAAAAAAASCATSAAGLSGFGNAEVADLPGFTRSVVERDHALITRESHVYSPLPGWTNTLAAYFISAAMGAHFSMFLAYMSGNATAGPVAPSTQRFLLVIEGEVSLLADGTTANLQPNFFAFIPAGQPHQLLSSCGAAVLIFEKSYTAASQVSSPSSSSAPQLSSGRVDQQPVLPVAGEVFVLRKMLPGTLEYDFNIHVMDFQPGEYLNVKEVHYNQHGLFLLEGRGIYRLGDKWYPVQAGDVIWMAPYVPQWYGALGKTRSRYILYKDTNRDPNVAS